MFLKICCVLVSVRIKQLGFFPSIRSARILICDWLSSPDTYNTFCGICKAICSNKVDLPIPGSPPNNTTAPFTNPPPKTVSNS